MKIFNFKLMFLWMKRYSTNIKPGFLQIILIMSVHKFKLLKYLYKTRKSSLLFIVNLFLPLAVKFSWNESKIKTKLWGKIFPLIWIDLILIRIEFLHDIHDGPHYCRLECQNPYSDHSHIINKTKPSWKFYQLLQQFYQQNQFIFFRKGLYN